MESVQAITSVPIFMEASVFKLRTAQHTSDNTIRKQEMKSQMRQFAPPPPNTQRAKQFLRLVPPPDEPQEPHTYKRRRTHVLMPGIPKKELLCGRPSRSTPIMRKYIFEDQQESKEAASGTLGKLKKDLPGRKDTATLKGFLLSFLNHTNLRA